MVEGSSHEETIILLEGWACRQTSLGDGARQIVGLILPEDFCSLAWRGGSDPCGVRALTNLKVARVEWHPGEGPHSSHQTMLSERMKAACVEQNALMAAWLLNIGQRKAPERLAHFLCELAIRMRRLGLEQETGKLEVPLTQQDLADALGLTTVHVNRVLQGLRERGHVDLRRGILAIKNFDGLAAFAEFDDRYLAFVKG